MVKEETFDISTPEHWKAFSHPLRLGILELLNEREMTNEELAKALAVESGKLYFHTKVLLKAGMIKQSGTRQKGPITEKLYCNTARNYVASPPKLDGEEAPFSGMMSAALSMYQNAWKEEPSQMSIHLGYNLAVSVPQDKTEDFARKLMELVQEFQKGAIDNMANPIASVTMLMYTMKPTSKRNAASVDNPIEK